MEVVDPGHKYILDNYDGVASNRITFMKREGLGYPGNVGHYPGTNLQEVLRVLIDRVKYLNNQIPCDDNKLLVGYLRGALTHLEQRAAVRHKNELNPHFFDQFFEAEIENFPACEKCGHIVCTGEHKH